MRFGSEQLRGHVFLANLLCVNCTGQGAVAAQTMRTLQHRSRNLGDALRLVTFSSDGTPAALAVLRRAQPSSERWELLVGATPGIRAFFPDDRGLVLVDGQLRLRGRYLSADPAALNAALQDAALILNER